MTTQKQLLLSTPSPYSKKQGMKPLPGYVLIEPLGRGGFGEVWKCEAPGGLHKAMKFVPGAGEDELAKENAKLRQELAAFQRIKTIRHPYLLCVERVELVNNELVMVMGLADRHLGDRFHECRDSGLPGIPREELLGYLMEAAEALDVIGTQHGLQHLDVKPANLFLTAGHVQVGDYGLVTELEPGTGTGKTRGLTPKYAAPEVLRGEIHTLSDQYSLALVYQELLTGTFPYSYRTTQQIVAQHASATPDLSLLPERDRGPVAIALSKQPGDRFPSCRAFIRALMSTELTNRHGLITPGQKSFGMNGRLCSNLLVTPAPVSPGTASASSSTQDLSVENEPTHQGQLAETAPMPSQLRRLVGVDRTPLPPPTKEESPPSSPSPSPEQSSNILGVDALGRKLKTILSVLPVEWLRGREAPEPDLPPNDMVRAVLAAASRGCAIPSGLAEVMQLPDGNWKCRFLTTIDPRVAKVKLDLLREQGGLMKESRDDRCVIFRRNARVAPQGGGFALFGKKPVTPPPSGIEIVVELPEQGGAVGEVSALGRIFGTPPPEYLESTGQSLISLLEGVRNHLNNFPDRRKHPRIPADFPVTVFPLLPGYSVDAPVSGRCENISAGGLAFRATSPFSTKYAYVAFDGVRGATGLALLVQIIQNKGQQEGMFVTAKFKLDLWPAPVL